MGHKSQVWPCPFSQPGQAEMGFYSILWAFGQIFGLIKLNYIQFLYGLGFGLSFTESFFHKGLDNR